MCVLYCRYLLEASREVEALAVYQRFHRLNKPGRNTQYGLTELELPSRSTYQRQPVSISGGAAGAIGHKSHISHSIDTVSYKSNLLHASYAQTTIKFN